MDTIYASPLFPKGVAAKKYPGSPVKNSHRFLIIHLIENIILSLGLFWLPPKGSVNTPA
jgi:hypothetical protein